MNARRIDLNADLGESFGVYSYGADEAMMQLITSANVACGFHGGDPLVIQESVRLACERGVRIGAHVGLPDRLGFGRREMAISAAEAYTFTLYQIGALDAFLRPHGICLAHVKPHGALYMMAARNSALAAAVAQAVTDFDPRLAIYTLPDSALAAQGRALGLRVVGEFFADRPYTGTEVTMFGWTTDQLGEPEDAADRVDAMLADTRFREVDTVCVHSDTPRAPHIMAVVRNRLIDKGLEVTQTGPDNPASTPAERRARDAAPGRPEPVIREGI
ncbi:5-oxoprolinase subunit PxpA [Nocardia sp. NPDC049190]|uniref:5-oxoprolinase subunit PxpA n=1 Tax=Nocardia sp. NPDC049190 TaxID=3155650 RepID=UPI0033D98441